MIAERLARVMRERTLSQADVAREINVGQPTVWRWLHGADPALSLYQRLVAAYPEIAEEQVAS